MVASIWQDLCQERQFCHWWQKLGERRLHAMATAIIVLLLVAALVALSIVRPAGPYFSNTAQGDHDRERQLAELRALVGYRDDARLP
jgi:hypothetical protein